MSDSQPETRARGSRASSEPEWLDSERASAASEAFWRARLAGAQSLDLPTDRPRLVELGCRLAVSSLMLDESLSERLRALSWATGATLHMLLLAAFQVLLSRWSGQKDIVVGSPSRGRTRVNALPMRVDLSANPSFEELLRDVKRNTLLAHAHQDIPFKKLAEMASTAGSNRHPVFQAAFDLRQTPHVAAEVMDPLVGGWVQDYGTVGLDLSLEISAASPALKASYEYPIELFDRQTIERLAGSFEILLSGIVEIPAARVGALPLLSAADRQQVVVSWNVTHTDYAAEKCVHELFAEQARKTPDAVALQCDDQLITYGELDRRTNQMAHYLRGLGVGPDVIVGLCLERSIDMVVGLLGILKAGGAYLPLDPHYPIERLEFMLQDARVLVIVTSSAARARLPDHEAIVVCVDGDWTGIEEGALESGVRAANLAYVLYTSGSTGKPKGVLGTHRLVAKRLHWDAGGSAEIYAQKTTPNFIDTLWELFMPLIRGQRVCIISTDAVMDPLRIIEKLARSGATRIVLVPALLRALLSSGERLADRLPNLRYWACSGEALESDLADEFKRCVPHARLVNIYGTSEFWDASAYEVGSENHPGGVSIGRPIDNTRLYVLDEWLEPVPIGVVGELYIGGTGLARGYLNRPGLTAERFIANPFGHGDRLYASGDLVRYRADGNLTFIGRRDSQVKIRGFRIELAEIETALMSHAAVSQAVVVARADAPGQKRLVGYVVSSQTVDITELRDHLQRRLPHHMVPSFLVVLNGLPLLPNGKIDRHSLPAPDGRPQIGHYYAPRTAVEDALAMIWRDVLRLDRVGIHDNFFELGGDSLSASRVAVRAGLPTHAVFEDKTVAVLAARLQGETASDDVPLEPIISGSEVETTFPQQLLLLQGPYEIGLNMGSAMSVEGPFDEGALRRALRALLQRQEALRCLFVFDGKAVRMRETAAVPDVLRVVSLEEDTADGTEQRVGSEVDTEWRRPFDLRSGPLARALLIRVSPVKQVFVFTVHHGVADAWSINIIKRELAGFYAEALNERQPRPVALPVSFSAFARWQHRLHCTDEYKRQLRYWADELADLRVDGAFPQIPSGALAASHHVDVRVPAGLDGLLKEFAARRGVTAYVILMAALHLSLARHAGLDQQVVWTPVARRPRPELEQPVGMCVNLMMISARASAEMTLREFLALIEQKVTRARANSDVSAMTALQLGLAAPPQLPVVGLNFIDLPNACDWRFSGATVIPMDLKIVDDACALELSVQFERGAMTATVTFKPAAFSADGVARIVADVWKAIECFVTSPDGRIADFRKPLC